MPPNIWFVSDEGSDANNCQTESAPCHNLQTVLNRASDGADIFVLSDTVSLNAVRGRIRVRDFEPTCQINSSFSFSISGVNGTRFSFGCQCEFLVHPVMCCMVELFPDLVTCRRNAFLIMGCQTCFILQKSCI